MLKIKQNSNDPFGILESTDKVIQNAKFVVINHSKINKIALLLLKHLGKELNEDQYDLGLSGNLNEDVQLLLVEDAVNFCFWAEKNREKWKVEWSKGKISSGGWFNLLAVFQRAKAENIPITNAKYLSCLTLKDVKKIFRGTSVSEIPLIEKRLKNLIDVGKVLETKFDGKFINLVEDAKFDAISIVKMVYDNFTSFRDEALYKGKKVYFLKRAQILANDLSYVSKNGKRINIKNLEKLTAFADYKIPQMLRHFGLVKYSKSLANKIDNYVLIKALSSEEVEIRSATVQGINLIKNKLKKYTASQIDNALWLLSQDQTKITKPYHRTYTIFY